MLNKQLLCAALLTATTGLAQAQAWHLPQHILLVNTCEAFYNVQYTPPAGGQNWGWYTANLDTTGCWYPAIEPASGPEAKRGLGSSGKGAVLTTHHPLYGGLVVFVVNADGTYALRDMAGNTLRSGTWT
jgi:hypothetical protein